MYIYQLKNNFQLTGALNLFRFPLVFSVFKRGNIILMLQKCAALTEPMVLQILLCTFYCLKSLLSEFLLLFSFQLQTSVSSIFKAAVSHCFIVFKILCPENIEKHSNTFSQTADATLDPTLYLIGSTFFFSAK